MILLPFTPPMAGRVASWPTDAAERRAWCSADAVSAADVAGWSAASDVEALVLTDGDQPVAYGEIWIDEEEGEVELAHLIVAPGRRCRGIGRRLVDELTTRGVHHHATVAMRVRPENLAAQRCYTAAGFSRASPTDEDAWNDGQPVAYVWMSLRSPDV